MFDLHSFDQFDLVFTKWFMGESLCHNLLQQDSIEKVIHSRDLYFDVVIFEAFVSECFLEFAHKFQAPIIQVSTDVGGNFMVDWVGSTKP
jgi:glucuronosyltransferase